MAPTRWGISSAGKIAKDFVNAFSLQSKEEHVVSAVATRDLNRSKEFADHYGIQTAYGTYEELAADPNIDIVYIAAINSKHTALLKLYINAGKNILCEKSLTLNEKDTREITALAKEKNVFLMEGLWSRCFPAYKQLKEDLSSLTIGEVKYMVVNFGFPVLFIENIAKKETGGGAMLSMGCYGVQLAQLVFGPEMPKKITAVGKVNSNGVDEYESVILQYSGDRTAVLNIHVDLLLDQKATLYGSKGIIEVPDFWAPTELVTPKEKHTYTLPAPKEPMILKNSEGFIFEQQCVRSCLLEGKKECPNMTLAESVNIATIMDEVFQQIGVDFSNIN